MASGKKKKETSKLRKPVAKKPGAIIGGPKGDKGYDRRKEKESLRKEIDEDGKISKI